MKFFGFNIVAIIGYWLFTRACMTKYHLKYILLNGKLLTKTKALRKIHAGRCCFVFANGPSLRKIDPDKIAALKAAHGYHVIAVNSYINTEFGRKVRPDYYVLSDPAHFGYNNHELSEKRKVEVQADLAAIISNKVNLFAPANFANNLEYEHIYPFCDSENLFGDNVTDICKPRGYLSMTAYKALSAACYMGYEKIYISGFDNDFFKSLVVDEDNVMYYKFEHFYESSHDPNITYNLSKLSNEGNSISEVLYQHHFLFRHLEKFKDQPIVNLDQDGLVDCFSKRHDLDVYWD